MGYSHKNINNAKPLFGRKNAQQERVEKSSSQRRLMSIIRINNATLT
jgi:hypothetical protein